VWIVGFVLCLALPSASASAATILSISPSAASINVGQSFSISLDIDITAPDNLYAYNFDVSYDPALMKVVQQSGADVAEGPFLGTGGPTFFISGVDDLNGSVSFTAATLLGLVSGITGSGTLASINFLSLAAGTGFFNLSNIQLQSGMLVLDPTSGEPIDVLTPDIPLTSIQVGSGSIDINSVTAVPEPATLLLAGTGLLMVVRQRLKQARTNR
jgi:general secretion pathway protein D